MEPKNKAIISNFIEEIWNQNQLEKVGYYLSSDFIDHSLPPTFETNAEGLKRWIIETGKSFEHKTIIEELVCEHNKVIIKIQMQLRHIGPWRNIAPTDFLVSTVGYRFFKLADGKIIEHWSLLDGNAIENQLKETSHGCKIQE